MQHLTTPGEKTRQCARKPYVSTMEYSVSLDRYPAERVLTHEGRTIDISDAGIGIETAQPLSPGCLLRFNSSINRTGVVKWSSEMNGSCRAGIEFVTQGKYTPLFKEKKGSDTLQVSEEKERYLELLDAATARFIKELEEIEKRCSDEGKNPEGLLNAVESSIDRMMYACAEFEKEVKSKDAIRNAKVSFHDKTNPLLSKSYCINRARTWPQGSQGDHKTLEMIYKNTPLSGGIGYYLDLCALNFQLGEGVRNRIGKLEEMLGFEIGRRHKPSVLNIGCGSCRELMGIAPEILHSEARIVCVDTDNDALAFAQDRLSYAGIISQVELRRYNALRMFDDETNASEFGNQDIIYSVGLFDYLPSDFLVKLFRSLYHLLTPGGKLIAAFKDASRYRSQDYHWIVDWDGFLQRTEEDFTGIMAEAGIPSECIAETREDSGVIVFYVITKQSDTQG